METVEQERLGQVLASCMNAYKIYDPKASKSGSKAGVAYRVATRRLAVEHLRICLGLGSTAEAVEVMEAAIR